jgi:uncharacterized protein YcbK (DUF882 family)
MLLKQVLDAICQNHSGNPVTLFYRLKPATPIDDHGVSSPRRRRWTVIAAIALGSCLASAPAFAETRSLKLHHLHTQEKAEIVYKRNGRYDAAGLKKINHLLRDWRRNEPIRMDPRLLDLVWQAHRQSGSNAYIQIVSGYRAPATNAMLRGRSKGVAKNSQHMLGKAMDFYIPGVPLKKLRDIGLKLQGGGVGYYPTSGSPFVHMDVGNVRHWPGINRQELARLFPEGKTLHVPSDGKPLPGYGQALAAYQARKASGTPNIEMASAAGGKRGAGNLLAALFGGGGADEADDMADGAPRAKGAKPAEAPKTEVPKAETPKTEAPGITIVAPELAQRADIARAAPDDAMQAPTPQTPPPQTMVAALAPDQIPVPAFAERSSVEPVTASLSVVPIPDWRPAAEPMATPQAGETQETLVASIAPVPSLTASRPSNGSASSKADRVTVDSEQARPLPVAMPAELHARYWPHRMELGISEIADAAPAPRLAAHFIRTAPVKIYVDGFRADPHRRDPRRFSG